MTPVKSGVLPQPDFVLSNSMHADEVLALMYKTMEYRSQEIRHRLEKVGRTASMLHMDVLLLIYHFAKITAGNILEIGAYIGGSTIAAAFGAAESGRTKKFISIEPGGRLKHVRIPSTNIFKDLKKNLARFGLEGSFRLDITVGAPGSAGGTGNDRHRGKILKNSRFGSQNGAVLRKYAWCREQIR